jgi:hypothetical protein
MKLKEATKIVNKIIEWEFVLQGITDREKVASDIDLKQYSLDDLLKANKLVSSNNNRKKKLQEYYIKKNGSANGVSIQMTLADRIIAGVYFAMHYQANGEIHVLIDDIGVGCVKLGGNRITTK